MFRRFFSFVAASCVLVVGLLPTPAMARLYVANETLNQVVVYSTNATGNTVPATIITGSNTGLSEPIGVAVDASHIYVANFEGTQGNSVTVYPIDAGGNAAPTATITGALTGLANCEGIAVDGNYIYVVCASAVG